MYALFPEKRDSYFSRFLFRHDRRDVRNRRVSSQGLHGSFWSSLLSEPFPRTIPGSRSNCNAKPDIRTRLNCRLIEDENDQIEYFWSARRWHWRGLLRRSFDCFGSGYSNDRYHIKPGIIPAIWKFPRKVKTWKSINYGEKLGMYRVSHAVLASQPMTRIKQN
jgi:hypothetical protein